MALWLIAVGEGAGLPRRLVYVVDRQAVVDQATRFAHRLRVNMPRELEERLGQRYLPALFQVPSNAAGSVARAAGCR